MPDAIYLDNNATTRPLDQVLDAMGDVQMNDFANPSSTHRVGQIARHHIETARTRVARLIGADPKEIIFTASGTESINLAMRGILSRRAGKRRIITSSTEHSSVRQVCLQLARQGYSIEEIAVDNQGRLAIGELEKLANDDTALITVAWANNETGVIFDVEQITSIGHDRSIPVHLDAVQAVGKVKVDTSALPVTLLSFSAHKMHGPKGVGALFVRRKTRIDPLIVGGGQERQMRAGTENVAGIVGMGVAAAILASRDATYFERIAGMRDRLERGICSTIDFASVNGAQAPRINNTTNIGFKTLQAEAILLLLSENGIYASAGAACSSGSLEPSHVLAAMSIDPQYAHGSIRFSLSAMNTEAEIEKVINLLPSLLSRLKVVSR